MMYAGKPTKRYAPILPKDKVRTSVTIRRDGWVSVYGLAWYNDRWNKWSGCYPDPKPLDRLKVAC